MAKDVVFAYIYYSAIRKKETLPFVTTWMILRALC